MPEIECSSCQQPIQDTDTFCRHCGTTITPSTVLCPSCNTELPHDSQFCSTCGSSIATTEIEEDVSEPQATPASSTETKFVNNYMFLSVLVTILCFWPTGLVAIYHACQVNSSLAQGDYKGAVESSKRAKFWSDVSWKVLCIFWVIVILIAIIVLVYSAITEQQSRNARDIAEQSYYSTTQDLDQQQTVKILSQQARAHYDFGDYDKAIKVYSQAIKLWPNWELFWGRGVAYTRLGNNKKACEDFMSASLDYENISEANFKKLKKNADSVCGGF